MADSSKTYGTKSAPEDTRGEEITEKLRDNTDGGKNAGRSSERARSQRLTLDRKNSSERNWASAIGGILAQLIQDTEKQLGKSRECVAWYETEIREYEEKLQNLKRLQELQEQQDLAALKQTEDEECEEYHIGNEGI